MMEFITQIKDYIANNLSGIGSILAGIAAMRGVNSFNRYRQENKSSAAIQLQTLIESYIEDLQELVLRPGPLQ